MTTKNAIKLLPMDEKLKTQLLNVYDFMEPDQKRTVQRIAWKTYFYMYHQKAQTNITQQLEEVAEGKGQFGKAFFAEVEKKTAQDLTIQFDKSSESVDLAAARQAMEQIIQEIRTVKKSKIHQSKKSN
ncbi:MAG TPA: hypothetical protein VNW29_03495 [Candidatus Sulfotelmatobacter sp.]|jgi:hypothetical protein|nr:hypothetical protein [Candidatus Sulfotelmatobacter sp.]